MKKFEEYEKKLSILFKERVCGRPDAIIRTFLDSYSGDLLGLFPSYVEWIKNEDPSDKEKIKRLKKILREKPFHLARVIRKAGIKKNKDIEWVLEMLCLELNSGVLCFFSIGEGNHRDYSAKWKRIFEKGK